MTDPKRSIYQRNLSNKKPHIYLTANEWYFSPVMYKDDWRIKMRLNNMASQFCAYLNERRSMKLPLSKGG